MDAAPERNGVTFSFRPATRSHVPLVLGLAGPSGGGKTMSALRLARGLAGDQKFCVIDTESGRAQMYADVCAPWDHGDLSSPFTPERYDEAISAADAAGYPVIVVDSFSHEHAGDGGLLDLHNSELDRMAGDDWKKREAVTFAAWVKPKASHKRLMAHLLQLRAHLVICLRADSKVEITKDERGRVKVIPKRSLTGVDGWIPIAEKTLAFELSMSLLVTPDRPGYPRPIKLPEVFKTFLPLDEPISEQTGRLLAEWAAGGAADTDPVVAELPVLITELLELADKLGKREETTAAITRNRQLHVRDLAAHAEWLRSQIVSARASVERLAAGPDGDLFSQDAPLPQEA